MGIPKLPGTFLRPRRSRGTSGGTVPGQWNVLEHSAQTPPQPLYKEIQIRAELSCNLYFEPAM